MVINEFKREIDKHILDFFNLKTTDSIYKNGGIDPIFIHLRKQLEVGKRIRPYIAFLSYKAFGGKEDKKAIELFSFIEFFHVFCLVHDDILDKADERHGIKTIHKFVSDSLGKNIYKDPGYFGNSQAILIGDLLFSWSWEVLLNNYSFEKESLERVKNVFFEMIDEVFIGQMIDLNISSKSRVSNQEILQKMLLKTAGYSLIKPMMIGAALAGETKKDYEFIKKFGTELGLAFQIQDDLLDIKYESSQTKKSTFSDIAEHQHTLFTNYVFEKGTEEQKKILKNLFGKEVRDIDREKLRDVFIKSGAIKHGEREVLKYLNRAENLLKESVIDDKSKKMFLNLINGLINRSN